MNWYLKVISNYATFSGRARRKEYWMFYLIHFLNSVILVLLDVSFGFAGSNVGDFGILYMIYALAMLVPYIAVTVRRLHDIGKSGNYIFVGLIPILGGIWLLVMMATEGDHGENAYGPDPKLDEYL